MKYRKRNSVVDARRFVAPDSHPLVEPLELGWRILTPEGWQNVSLGDWILTDAKGVSWAMPDEMFVMLYEQCGSEP
jgi:hypothetical protein